MMWLPKATTGTGRALLWLPALLLLSSCDRGPAPETRTIRIAVPYDVGTLDPHARDTLSNLAVLSHLYEPLVSTDRDMTIRPCLTRSWENPDDSTWIFHLRPSIRFHSGRPLRAADVVFSIQRLLGDSRLEIAGYVLYLTEVTALDPLTVRIRTARPPSVFLGKLRFVSIVPEGSNSADLAQRADGTGPYRLERWQTRELVSLRRNEDYWGAKPELTAVEILLNRSSEQAVEDLLASRCQLAEFNSKPLEAGVQAAGKFEILRRPSLFLKYIGFDVYRDASPYLSVKPNPFRKRAVREAVNLAIDRRQLVSRLATEAVPATQLVPSSYVFGFDPRIPPPAHDPSRARALLREARLGGGFRATLHVRKIFPEAAYLVKDQLKEIGIDLNVSVLGDEDFFELARRRDFSMFLTRVGSGTGDASDILENAVHSLSADRSLGYSNYGGYANPEVDRAIEESARLESASERRQAIERIVSRVMEDVVWIPLYVDQHVYALDRTFSWQPRNDNCVLAAEITRRQR